MKKLVPCVVLLIAAVAGAATLSARQAPDPTREIVKSYLEIQAQLAGDRTDGLKAPSRAIAAQAAAVGPSGATLAKAAAAIEGAADITAAREAFGPLSDAVIARVQADGSKEAAADLKIAYCPMVKKSWLQREDQVRNPYYGAQMLTCGELKPLK